MDNQLIHEWVMDMVWHGVDMSSANKQGKCRCLCGRMWVHCYTKVNPDYSDPTNYEALSSKFREWGEWYFLFLTHRQTRADIKKIRTGDDWEGMELVDRIPLIADYIRSKGVEYWDIRRKG